MLICELNAQTITNGEIVYDVYLDGKLVTREHFFIDSNMLLRVSSTLDLRNLEDTGKRNFAFYKDSTERYFCDSSMLCYTKSLRYDNDSILSIQAIDDVHSGNRDTITYAVTIERRWNSFEYMKSQGLPLSIDALPIDHEMRSREYYERSVVHLWTVKVAHNLTYNNPFNFSNRCFISTFDAIALEVSAPGSAIEEPMLVDILGRDRSSDTLIRLSEIKNIGAVDLSTYYDRIRVVPYDEYREKRK
jgi:hypothetical protein